ncbi:hypothetical protein TGPRC2_274050 [Toxoplasma gondii TgCatPRC2]|uniref:Uncharacterized protein n=5 Tax=Toxoplasma gondii TaxID=5811 RepID=A0A0F7UYH4_TOXGV|nr:hypothetical protein TGME49_274050 [Toxoplasma gondii ME49]ESS36056.1 hypothetical protein TGVEG_274050 [Toxoplasma gondii VEG]KYF46371.1 hypothetical protein TGARI_274050 [Toxoplasma gondii ARI]KYK71433.1 hypothetical protein TGPRC2_274050 [Toxoplasma gondii TgCatPRC2]PIM04222.1 hypothetical protein TGCOUG_274050 [Toxoplasma gondii COUG]EPT28712.1 hypothetical protein TGME49_274050 [Toxoplasma gondii ME49]|eukprot:XP_018636749.1 hypothetical protein TGME49_274050 [Toxoplasma gondii ME49]
MSFTEKLQQRRKIQEDTAKVFEDYGKKKQIFKTGKSRLLREDCEKQLRELNNVGSEPPTEVCEVELPAEEHTTPTRDLAAAHPAPSPPGPELRVRKQWVLSENVKFRQDRKSPEVLNKAKEISVRFGLPKDVCLRLGLLFQFRDTKRGEDMLTVYLTALQRLKQGFDCAKLAKRSLKVKKKFLKIDPKTRTLYIKGLGPIFRKTTALDLRAVQDVYAGTSESPEFQEVNRRIKTLGHRLEENRCCVVKTEVRTYSLILNSACDTDDLFATVDLLKGNHGPAVWREDNRAAENVFRVEGAMDMSL